MNIDILKKTLQNIAEKYDGFDGHDYLSDPESFKTINDLTDVNLKNFVNEVEMLMREERPIFNFKLVSMIDIYDGDAVCATFALTWTENSTNTTVNGLELESFVLTSEY